MCRIHGKGARRTWRKVLRTVLGPGGKPEVREVRKTQYICDLDPRGGGRLRQPTLSYLLKTTLVVDDDTSGFEESKGEGEL